MSLSRSSSLSLNSFIGRHEELTESLANNQPRPVNPPNDVELSKEPMRPQARPARRNLLGLLQYSWLWEILAVLFSLVCVITIIVVLRYEDGRFLDQWNLKISVNAVVSFIGALAKSSFMLAIVEIISQLKWLHFQRQPQRLEDLNTYDESSRGPWGSVKLLALGYVDKKSLLASWAALVTIFALFVDPALQLVIVQPSKLAPSSQQPAPAFQVSQVYDPNDYPDDGHLTFYNVSSVNVQMQSYILGSVYESPMSPQMLCPTKQCNWTEMTTLGVCASCDDAMQNIVMDCSSEVFTSSGFWPLACNYTVVGNTQLQGFYGEEGASGFFFSTQWNSTAVSLGSESAPGQQALLSAFQMVKLGDVTNQNYSDGSIGPTALPPVAAKACGFYMCAKTYVNASYSNGVPQLSSVQETVLTRDEAYLNETKAMIRFTASNNNSTRMNTTFAMNSADYSNLGEYLAELFTVGFFSNTEVTRGAREGQTTTPAIGKALYESDNITQTLVNVANGMTEAIRTGSNGSRVLGQSFEEKTFIRVQWGWLALPISLMVMTLALLVIVIALTHREQMVAWKSSALAVLFHDVCSWDAGALTVTDEQGLRRTGNASRVRLGSFAGRPAFVKQA